MYSCHTRWYTVVDEMSVDEMYTKCRRRNVRRRVVVEPIQSGIVSPELLTRKAVGANIYHTRIGMSLGLLCINTSILYRELKDLFMSFYC